MPRPSMADPVPLLRDLIRCPSVTPESAGVFEVLQPALESLGFTVARHIFAGDGSYPVENLFATRGTGGRHLLFCGHTDVVPPGAAADWSHPPFAAEIVDGAVIGRGAADMKSGIAAFVAGVATFLGTPGAEAGTISLAITNDEEADAINGTEKLLAWAAAAGHRFDFAIVGEPSSAQVLGDSIKIGRRGSLNGRITVTGVQGHAAYPDRARNPLPVMAEAISRLSAARLDTGTAQFPPTNLEFTALDTGNMASNVIPGRVTALFNIRFNDLWTPDSLADRVNETLAGVDSRGCQIAFETVGRASQCFLSPRNEAVETLCRTIEAQLGARPELSTAGGTSDARFVAQYCPVVECGLPGSSMHKVDEQVHIADLEGLARLYAAFLAAYFA